MYSLAVKLTYATPALFVVTVYSGMLVDPAKYEFGSVADVVPTVDVPYTSPLLAPSAFCTVTVML